MLWDGYFVYKINFDDRDAIIIASAQKIPTYVMKSVAVGADANWCSISQWRGGPNPFVEGGNLWEDLI